MNPRHLTIRDILRLMYARDVSLSLAVFATCLYLSFDLPLLLLFWALPAYCGGYTDGVDRANEGVRAVVEDIRKSQERKHVDRT